MTPPNKLLSWLFIIVIGLPFVIVIVLPLALVSLIVASVFSRVFWIRLFNWKKTNSINKIR
jgi:hypothetical protein